MCLFALVNVAMISHPPIPVMELSDHIEHLKGNENLLFSQEYEVRHSLSVCHDAGMQLFRGSADFRVF